MSDPWLIILACPTEANARLIVDAMKKAGIENAVSIAKRSEARAVLAENISPTPKMYNKPALEEPEFNPYAIKKRTPPRATRSRLQ